MVGIEEVAVRNQFRLYPTTRFGQFKAHCPSCYDKQRQFHLYVSSVKDTFFCQKCGAKGGVVAFHAWLKGIPFQAARNELYPEGERRLPRHPAEQLTYEQRAEAGFTTRLPSPIAPKAFTQKEWNRYRRRTLDWIWREWREYEQFRKAQDERLYRLVCEGMGIEVSGQRTSLPEDLAPNDYIKNHFDQSQSSSKSSKHHERAKRTLEQDCQLTPPNERLLRFETNLV